MILQHGPNQLSEQEIHHQYKLIMLRVVQILWIGVASSLVAQAAIPVIVDILVKGFFPSLLP